MTPAAKRAYLQWGGLAALFAVVAGLLLLVLPTPHKPLHYLVAGTCATAALLVAVFGILRRGGNLLVPGEPRPDHTAPENGPPS